MYFMSLPVKRHFTRNRRSQNLFPPEKPHTSLAVVHSMSSFTISTNHTIVASWSRPAAKSAEGRPSLVISLCPNAYHNNGSICIRSGGNLARASKFTNAKNFGCLLSRYARARPVAHRIQLSVLIWFNAARAGGQDIIHVHHAPPITTVVFIQKPKPLFIFNQFSRA